MKIVELKAENVKRLEAVEIAPDGSVVVVGGRNGAGKSSVLDSILMALSGAASIPGKPVREGADEAKITLRIDGEPGLLVIRKIKGNGKTSLEVSHEFEGLARRVKSPQKLLDTLVGRIAFDPLQFTKMKPADQLQTLREIVGVDTTEIDVRIDALFSSRADANREVKRLEGVVSSMTVFPDAPEEEQAASTVLTELREAQAKNSERDAAGDRLDSLSATLTETNDLVGDVGEEIERLEALLKENRERREKLLEDSARVQEELESVKAEYEAMPTVDLAPIEQKLESLEGVNAKVRANKAQADAKAELVAARQHAAELTDQVESARKEKLKLMDSATWPVEGLGFGSDGVTFNGFPFEQCSSAEQLRIGAAIGLSQNPELPVLLIRDGSLLDADSLQAIRDIADKYDAQVWIERVSDGAECSVIIEEGHVAERPSEAEAVGA